MAKRKKPFVYPPITKNDTGIFQSIRIGPARNKAEATGLVYAFKELVSDRWPLQVGLAEMEAAAKDVLKNQGVAEFTRDQILEGFASGKMVGSCYSTIQSFWLTTKKLDGEARDALDLLRLLHELHTLMDRNNRDSNNMEALVRIGIVIGQKYQAMLVRWAERFAKTGRLVHKGGEAGQNAAHGTQEKKNLRHDQCKQIVKRIKSENPDLGMTTIYKRAAKEMKLKAHRTIMRYLKKS